MNLAAKVKRLERQINAKTVVGFGLATNWVIPAVDLSTGGDRRPFLTVGHICESYESWGNLFRAVGLK